MWHRALLEHTHFTIRDIDHNDVDRYHVPEVAVTPAPCPNVAGRFCFVPGTVKAYGTRWRPIERR